MATTLSQSSHLRSWDPDRRPQSQPQSTPRDRRRSERHRIQARGADPVIINSILESFDALHSPTILAAEDHSFVPVYTPSRPHTAGEATSSTSTLSHAAARGFGMEYGHSLTMDDETGIIDAALAPIVGTSRAPFDVGVLTYRPTRSPSFMSVRSSERRRSSSFGSRTSASIAAKGKDSPNRYKLSSESWVKQGPSSPGSPPKDLLHGETSVLRRKSSDESARAPPSRIELTPTPTPFEPPSTRSVSRAEQIIALASAPRGGRSKRRIYLTDTASVDEERAETELPASITEVPELSPRDQTLRRKADADVDSTVQRILEEHVKMEEVRRQQQQQKGEGSQITPKDTSPARGSIVDSIPLRTSSLRQSSRSPAPGKKRERKSKRKSETARTAKLKAGAHRDSLVSSVSSQDIPDSSWNDLGEEDETVRRIFELRELRKARLLEPPQSPIRGLSPSANSDMSFLSQASTRSADAGAGSPLRSIVDRNVSESSPSVQRKVARATELAVPSFVEQSNSSSNLSQSKGTPSRDKFARHDTSSSRRPPSAMSNGSLATPIRLDYSYTDALDVLQDGRPEIRNTSPVPLALPVRNTSGLSSTVRESPESTSGNSRSKPSRWKTFQHPDLPLSGERKSSRRTPSLDNEPDWARAQPDTVELAVREYLQAPRLNQRIKHPLTGRLISFSEVGDREGAAVIVCLGMGLTRYVSAFYDELAATLRLRLITLDRPGVGNSEPYPANDKSGPLSWPDDVLAVCQHLGITKFSILAHSAGAIYALATALILPHLVKGRLHLLSPWIPPSQLETFSHATASPTPGAVLPRSQRLLRVLPTPFFKAANASFMNVTSSSLRPGSKAKTRPESRQSNLNITPETRPASMNGHRRESMMLMDQFMPEMNPTDPFPSKSSRNSTIHTSANATPKRASFAFASASLTAADYVEQERKHEYTALLTQRTWELATRDSNPATDLLVCLERHHDIGFRYTDVHQQVVIMHGSEDKRVPVANVRWLAEQMNRHAAAFRDSRVSSEEGEILDGPGCEMRVLEGEGHGLMASPLIMGDVLTEIAGYWRGGAL
ncbi:hypothetical protein BDY17DRAFT_292132 [Neohortaea acidophila]|uniref:AB hydrolase-1 domain-containing protein n=1 Tax=Neohortaea acidophila TaxID=245834 RepID=A0A6A6Q437_9PEZI|nr:uncharacterized protein BDY17DRAFT_292132 [Neohortaea acidophila]KAF2486799.1 hypothetical protein BDY17DRAFT_292132 [Neohortaea acidophila]